MKYIFSVLALIFFVTSAATATLPFKLGNSYRAVFVRDLDGDTIMVRIPAWRRTPFEMMAIRVNGIDTPEMYKQFAECAGEIQLGLAAAAFARTLAKPGDPVTFKYQGQDKYFRLDASVRLVNKGDWATIMLSKGYARPYNGGKKSSWC